MFRQGFKVLSCDPGVEVHMTLVVKCSSNRIMSRSKTCSKSGVSDASDGSGGYACDDTIRIGDTFHSKTSGTCTLSKRDTYKTTSPSSTCESAGSYASNSPHMNTFSTD